MSLRSLRIVAKDGRSTATNCQHLCKRKYLFVREGKEKGRQRERERERGTQREGEKERERGRERKRERERRER
jgi:hypothetical protein